MNVMDLSAAEEFIPGPNTWLQLQMWDLGVNTFAQGGGI